MISFAVLLFSLFSFGVRANVSLKDAFESAKGNMESLKRAHLLMDAANERRRQAKAALFPTISAVANETRIDPPDRSRVNRAFILERQYSRALRLQQPLFRGGVGSAYDLRKEEHLLSEFQKNATELNLYQLVINAYFRYYQAELDLKNIKDLQKFSQERVREIRSRTSIGRSRRQELVQAEVQLLTSQAQIDRGTMELTSARQNLEFLTGIPVGELAPLTLLPRELPSVETYVQKLRERADLLSSKQSVRIADERIGIARGGHFPSVDLVSNYYFERTGALESSEWDASVQIVIPLYQGGGVSAGVREAVAQKNAVEYEYRQSVRSAETELMVLYQNYQQTHSQLDALRDAVKKAEEAWRLNQRDYQNGLVTNLDVLQSLNIFIETKRTYDLLLAGAHMTYKNIEARSGVLP